MFCCIITLALIVTIECGTVYPYSPLDDCHSGVYTIYSSSTPITTGALQQYIITYPSSMASNPQIIYSIKNYEDQNSFSNPYIKMSMTNNDNPTTQFKIFLMLGGTSSITNVQISYMAIIDPTSAIKIFGTQFTTFSSVNTGSGLRTETKTTNYGILSGGDSLNSDLSKNIGTVFLVGFDMTITSFFKISLSLTISTTTSLSTGVQTQADCLINMVNLRYLLIDTGLWDSVDPPIIASYSSFSGSDQNVTVTNFHTITTKMFGLIGFEGNINNNFRLNYLPQGGDTVLIDNSDQFSSVSYGFIMIGQEGCPNSYPYTDHSDSTICWDQCPSTDTQLPSSNICSPCSSLCLQCGSTPSLCTDCDTDKVLVGNNCENTAISEQQEEQGDSGFLWPLLGLLGVIPVAGGSKYGYKKLVIYYLLRRRASRVIVQHQMHPQMSI